MNARDLVATSGENGGFTIFDKDKGKKFENDFNMVVPNTTQLNIFHFQKPNENVIYSVVGEENIQVKTEVRMCLLLLRGAYYS